MRVAVLGSGPAGMLAAHACYVQDVECEVFSVGGKSRILGAQQLQSAIPRLTNHMGEASLRFVLLGNPVIYAEKGGGVPWKITSWHDREDGVTYPCWNLREAYDLLWDRTMVNELLVSPDSVVGFVSNFDLVVSTIPARALCLQPEEHWFSWYAQAITDGLPDYILPAGNFVAYNGNRNDEWVRCSRIFGHESTEWPPDYALGRKVRKPIDTNCNCHPRVMRAGRYGCWNKRGLVHDAFWDVLETIPNGGYDGDD